MLSSRICEKSSFCGTICYANCTKTAFDASCLTTTEALSYNGVIRFIEMEKGTFAAIFLGCCGAKA